MNEEEMRIIKQYKAQRRGMCKKCSYSYKTESNNVMNGWLYCTYYRSYCKLVSRNCKGSK